MRYLQILGVLVLSISSHAFGENLVMSQPQGTLVVGCERSLHPAPHFAIADQGDHLNLKWWMYTRGNKTSATLNNDPFFFFPQFEIPDQKNLFAFEFSLDKKFCRIEKNGVLFACKEVHPWSADPKNAPITLSVHQIKQGVRASDIVSTNTPILMAKVALSRVVQKQTYSFDESRVTTGKPFYEYELNVDLTGIAVPFKKYGNYSFPTMHYAEGGCRRLH